MGALTNNNLSTYERVCRSKNGTGKIGLNLELRQVCLQIIRSV
jgi:hypothetical protein